MIKRKATIEVIGKSPQKSKRYQNPDGSFKEMTCPDDPSNKSKFCGCVRYFMSEEGGNLSLERAKKMCGYIKRRKYGSEEYDLQGDVIKLETPDEDFFSDVLDKICVLADRGTPVEKRRARRLLSYIWDGEDWLSIKDKLDTEGSVWYVWWMDGVHSLMMKMSQGDPKVLDLLDKLGVIKKEEKVIDNLEDLEKITECVKIWRGSYLYNVLYNLSKEQEEELLRKGITINYDNPAYIEVCPPYDMYKESTKYGSEDYNISNLERICKELNKIIKETGNPIKYEGYSIIRFYPEETAQFGLDVYGVLENGKKLNLGSEILNIYREVLGDKPTSRKGSIEKHSHEGTWLEVDPPIYVRMKNDAIYEIIAEDTVEFGRYKARTPWGEEVIIWDEDIEEWDIESDFERTNTKKFSYRFNKIKRATTYNTQEVIKSFYDFVEERNPTLYRMFDEEVIYPEYYDNIFVINWHTYMDKYLFGEESEYKEGWEEDLKELLIEFIETHPEYNIKVGYIGGWRVYIENENNPMAWYFREKYHLGRYSRQKLSNNRGYTFEEAQRKARTLPDNIRWVYGNRYGLWYPITKEDRDYDVWGIPNEEFMRMTEQEALATQDIRIWKGSSYKGYTFEEAQEKAKTLSNNVIWVYNAQKDLWFPISKKNKEDYEFFRSWGIPNSKFKNMTEKEAITTSRNVRVL